MGRMGVPSRSVVVRVGGRAGVTRGVRGAIDALSFGGGGCCCYCRAFTVGVLVRVLLKRSCILPLNWA